MFFQTVFPCALIELILWFYYSGNVLFSTSHIAENQLKVILSFLLMHGIRKTLLKQKPYNYTQTKSISFFFLAVIRHEPKQVPIMRGMTKLPLNDVVICCLFSCGSSIYSKLSRHRISPKIIYTLHSKQVMRTTYS